MAIYAQIVRKPYKFPVTVKRDTKEEMLRDFPDAEIIHNDDEV